MPSQERHDQDRNDQLGCRFAFTWCSFVPFVVSFCFPLRSSVSSVVEPDLNRGMISLAVVLFFLLAPSCPLW
jgi:hypothetical protein